MARVYFVAFFIAFFWVQWTVSEEDSAFQIYTGKCEDMEHDVILNFSNVGFTKIGDHLINSPRVSCLSLSNNEIAEVSDRAFDLLPKLSYLDVSNNKIESNRLFCVGEGTNITTLVLDNNVIRNPYRDHSTMSPSYYGYHAIHHTMSPSYDYDQPAEKPECSLVFPNLKHIYARGCNLRTNNMAYLLAPKLTHLYLSFNNIDSLDFLNKVLQNATHIYLDGNNVVSSEGYRFSKRFLHLDLSFNGIKYICYQYCSDVGISFVGVTGLRFLSLADNEISNIESDTFDDARNLTTLDLSNNTIVGFKKGTFDSLNSLQNLSLSHNNLKDVPDIYALLSLKHLDLSFNDIETISSMRIAHNAVLESIDLSNNKISSVADDTFVNLSSLAYLNLSQNKMAWLSQNWITPLRNLQVLHIGGNNFKNSASLHLNDVHTLTDVYLDDSDITLTAVDMYNISPNLSVHINKRYYETGHICPYGPQ